MKGPDRMALFNGINVTLGPESSKLEHALAYARAGLRVFPVHGIIFTEAGPQCTCGLMSGPDHKNAGKHPATVRGHNDASTDEIQIMAWFDEFAPERNIGIATGQGTAVIDADVSSGGLEVIDHWEELIPAAGSLPPTLWCRTGSGGLHLWFTIDPGITIPSRNRVFDGIDVKSDGGYVVAPPSLHYSGGTYTWETDTDVAHADSQLTQWLMTARGKGGVSSHSFDFSAGPQLGQRDDFFNALGFKLRKEGWNWDAALAHARTIWEKTPQVEGDHYAWSTVEYKFRRNWEQSKPDDGAVGPSPTQANFLRLMQLANPEPPRPSPVVHAEPVKPAEPVVVEPTTEPVTEPAVDASDAPADADTDVVDAPEPPHSSGEADEETRNRRSILNTPPELETELTQAGLSHRFIRAFEGRFKFVPGLGWHRWNGVAWQVDDLDDALDATQYLLLQLRREQAEADEERQRAYVSFYTSASSIMTRKMTLAGAAVDPRMKAAARSLNTDPLSLVTHNGTLDLKTGRLRPSLPDDLNTQIASVTYDEDARCPQWERHVALVSRHADGTPDPELAAYYQRWAGYSLTGLVKEQSFFFAYGEGNNGKNVFIETLLGLLGSYAMRGSSKILVGGSNEHETVIADLAGARMVFIDETPQGRINEARLKELTGSERIRARKMRQDSFEFDARFKLWISGNNRPRVVDTTKGFWRRLHLAPFDTTIPVLERDPLFSEKLKLERAGILNWALEGLESYLTTGLAIPKRVLDAGHEYQDDENLFGQFVAEYFIDGAEATFWTPNNVLYHAYTQWCESTGVKPVSMQKLTNDWRQCGFVRDAVTKKIKQGFPRTWKVQRGYTGKPLNASIPANLQWDGMYSTPNMVTDWVVGE